jgi:hypothetical protein
MRHPFTTALLLPLVAAILFLPDVARAQCDHAHFTFCPADTIVYACDDGEEPRVTVDYPTPTAVDDCGAAQTFLRSGPPPGSSLPPGRYDVVWEARDEDGFPSASCIFEIHVIWRPTIECPQSMTVRACSPHGANVDYPVPTAYDDCGPIEVHLVDGPPPGGFFPFGPTQVTWRTNEDQHGADRDCSFYVYVEWPRTMICPGDTTITICPGLNGIHVNYTVPQFFDDCGPIEGELVDGPPPGGLFPPGLNHVTYRTERDGDDVALYCSFDVRIQTLDDEPPTLTCPAEVNAILAPGQSNAVVNFDVKATDDCPGEVTVECDPPSGSTFQCGATTVTCTARDANQNVSQCEFSVNVGIPVSVDVKPGACPNPFNTSEQGVIPVAIHGTPMFDVAGIDPASVRLEGVPAVHWALADVGAPYEPLTGKDDCLDCASLKKDRIRDLTLKFNAPELRAALGPMAEGECRIVYLTGNLADGCPIVGEDVLKINLATPDLAPIDVSPEVVPAALSSNHPNPFSAGSRIEYSLPRSGRTRLVLYDVLGRAVRVLVDQEQSAGNHSLTWDGRDERGAQVTGGLYFYLLAMDSADGSEALKLKGKVVLNR